jgi:hypothetical protein
MMEARRYHRRPVDLVAILTVDGGDPEACRFVNLSMGGAFVALRQLPHGTRVRLSFRIPLLDDDVVATGTVQWSEGACVGVRFDGLRARETWALGRFLDSIAPESPVLEAR